MAKSSLLQHELPLLSGQVEPPTASLPKKGKFSKTAPKNGRIDIPESQVKLIFGHSAGYCSFPGCVKRNLIPATEADDATVVGQIAHIHSYKDNGPRANTSLTLKQRNRYENLILLCGYHHEIVDKQKNTYTAEDLRTWKADLEKRLTQIIASIMPDVGFAQLQVLTNGLLQTAVPVTTDLSVLPPQDKMEKNGLSPAITAYLQIALGRANVVSDFVNEFTKLDSSFAQQLKAGFSKEYEALKHSGRNGDELFEEMLMFASLRKYDLKSRTAGLALLGYFFESCEVFER